MDTKGASVSGTPVAGGVGQIDLEIADYNGDGNADLIFPGALSGLETMLPGNGDGYSGRRSSFRRWGRCCTQRCCREAKELPNARRRTQLWAERPHRNVWEIQRDGTVGTPPIATTGSWDARNGTGGQVVAGW